MRAKTRSVVPNATSAPENCSRMLDRRTFLRRSLALAGGCAVALRNVRAIEAGPGLKPIGKARGVHPGRVVWAHDPEVTDWKGPGDGHWWEGNRLKQERVDVMMAQAVCELTGETKVSDAWNRLFRHLNRSRGKGDAGYRPGEKLVVKPNWVGLIYREGHVDTETYRFISRHDYMNTTPQMIIAVVAQLTSVGVRQSDITVCDTLACVVHEYYQLFHERFPELRFEDHAGKFGRAKVKPSSSPLFWSSRPKGKAQDYAPDCFAEADYLVNFATLKAHTAGGVTLCAKNHYGSLVRWPVQDAYYDIHPACFATQTGVYRPLVDLTGHADFGGKTVLYLIDGIFSGVHPRDPVPQKMHSPPFNGHWPCSLFASQDPVAIDSVGFDFLWTEWTDFPRKGGVDDYLHEAALANDPPSGTFYDPNNAAPRQRLASLGVHEHWDDPLEKRYSRNLGTGEGIELIQSPLGSRRQG